MQGVGISGVSPEGMQAMCSSFIEAGTFYRRLTGFSKPSNVDSFYQSGLIFQAFTGGVRIYMQYYRGCILSIMEGEATSLMQIKHVLMKVFEQIRYYIFMHMCISTDECFNL